MKRLLSRLLPVVAGLLFATAASAQTANLQVTARVNAKCSIAATAAVAFGVYDPLVVNGAVLDGGVDKTGTGTLEVRCNKGSAYWITFDKAGGPMAGPGAVKLVYGLFEDLGHTTAVPLVDTAGSLLRSASVADKTPIPHTIYGLIVADQDVSVGDWSDTVVATVNY